AGCESKARSAPPIRVPQTPRHPLSGRCPDTRITLDWDCTSTGTGARMENSTYIQCADPLEFLPPLSRWRWRNEHVLPRCQSDDDRPEQDARGIPALAGV